MTTLSDARFDALVQAGFSGSTNDMLLQWLQASGATSPSLNDAWMEYLTAQGFTTGTITDRMFAYLRAEGLTGSISDMWLQFWERGLYTLDPTNLVTNGDFASDLSGWTSVQWIWFNSAILQGDLTVDQPISQDITTVGGERYLVKFELAASRTGPFQVTFGSETLLDAIPAPEATNYSFITDPVTGTSNTISFIGVSPQTNPQFIVDNVSVQRIIPAS